MSTCDKRSDFWPEPSDNPPVDGIELTPMTINRLDEILEIENLSFPIPWSREAFEYDLTKNPMAYYYFLLADNRISPRLTRHHPMLR